MAKKAKEKQEKPIEVSLWESANKLRGSVEPSEYKHVVLGLIFLKFVSDKFEEHRSKLIVDGKQKYVEMPEFYNMSNVFFLEEISRWNYIKEKAKQDDLALIIDTALHTIEKDNKSLKDYIDGGDGFNTMDYSSVNMTYGGNRVIVDLGLEKALDNGYQNAPR